MFQRSARYFASQSTCVMLFLLFTSLPLKSPYDNALHRQRLSHGCHGGFVHRTHIYLNYVSREFLYAAFKAAPLTSWSRVSQHGAYRMKGQLRRPPPLSFLDSVPPSPIPCCKSNGSSSRQIPPASATGRCSTVRDIRGPIHRHVHRPRVRASYASP